jgi:hypothetical protein
MERMFIETFEFQKMWADLRLNDDELRELQGYLMKNPDAGRMIQGTGEETIYLVTAYGKSETDSLTAEERKEIKAFVKRIE